MITASRLHSSIGPVSFPVYLVHVSEMSADINSWKLRFLGQDRHFYKGYHNPEELRLTQRRFFKKLRGSPGCILIYVLILEQNKSFLDCKCYRNAFNYQIWFFSFFSFFGDTFTSIKTLEKAEMLEGNISSNLINYEGRKARKLFWLQFYIQISQ